MIERTNGEFGLTDSGRLLADAVVRFKREAKSALRLASVLEAVGGTPPGVDIDAFAGATVTSAEQGNSYAPVNRFESLLRSTNELRFVGSEIGLMEPCLDAVVQLIGDGVDVTLVDRPSCTRYFLSEYPERSGESLERENFTVWETRTYPRTGSACSPIESPSVVTSRTAGRSEH